MNGKSIQVKIDEVVVDTDPQIRVFNWVLDNDSSEWRETFGSSAESKAFAMGLRAAASMLGGHYDEFENVIRPG